MTIGLVLTAFTLGMRHGVDWDHIAAIADLTGSAADRRRGWVLSMWYALGHAAVVFALGTCLLVVGASLPEGVDRWMGRIVGVTLLALGAWVLVELRRGSGAVRLRSRWMLVIDGTFAGLRRVRRTVSGRRLAIEHEHPHRHDRHLDHDTGAAHDHDHTPARADAGAPLHEPAFVGTATARPAWWWPGSGERTHRHRHRHELHLPDAPTATPGRRVATGVGMLHGVGVESPTQISVFVASTSVAGSRTGVALLAAWVVGLVVANGVLAVLAGRGMLGAETGAGVHRWLAVVVAIASVGMGGWYLLELGDLPALLS